MDSLNSCHNDPLLDRLQTAVAKVSSREVDTTNDMLCMCSCSKPGEPIGVFNDWGLLFKCSSPSCGTCISWVVCLTCPNIRKQLRGVESFSRHSARNHKLHSRNIHAGGTIHKKRRILVLSNNCDNLQDESTPMPSLLVAAQSHAEQSAVLMECEDHNSIFVPSDNDVQVDDMVLNFPTMFTETVNKNIIWESCLDGSDLGHRFGPSKLFFYHAHVSNNADAGMEYLVKTSVTGKELHATELEIIKFGTNQCRLHMTAAHLAHSMSRMYHPKLLEIIQGFYKMGLEDGYATASEQINCDYNSFLRESNFQMDPEMDLVKNKVTRPFQERTKTRRADSWSTPVPNTVADIRRLYLDGKFSIVANLPMPKVHAEVPDHAYFSIIDCIRDFLAHKGDECLEAITEDTVNQQGPVEYRCQSNRAKTIQQNVLDVKNKKGIEVIGNMLFTWSDDCETHAMNKMHREGNGVWVKTLTIGTINAGGQTMRATYPLAVGKKGVCHDVVERIHARELNPLKNGTLPPFYMGCNKRTVRLNFELYATLQDQPERRTANKLIGGNSQFGCRWGVSADHGKLYNKWKACYHCIVLMKAKFASNDFSAAPIHCEKCLNWNVLADSPLAYSQPTDNYPTTTPGERNCRLVRIGLNNYLKPFRLSYDNLRAAIDVAHNGYVTNGWTQKNCVEYLKVECLNDNFIDKFLEHAVNVTAFAAAEEAGDQHLLAQMREHLRLNPTSYLKCPVPALWDRDGVNLTTHVDAIMHLIFLGIVKSLALKVQKWLTLQEKNASFIRMNAPYLRPFKSMNIAWLKVLQYKGGAFGGYVSENWLAFSRIMRWFYQNVGESSPVNEHKPPTGLHQSKWKKVYNEHWLKERDLDATGYADELSRRVAGFMAMPNCPEPVPKPERNDWHVENAIISLHDLLECVMSKKIHPQDIVKTEFAVRLFLSAYDELDTNLRTKGTTPGVVSKYNFCCLMNVPEAMREFGPLRNLWEGEYMGEGILRVLKPHMIQGMKRDWQSHLLRNMMREKAFATILKDDADKHTCIFEPHGLKYTGTQFHKYDSQLQIIKNVNLLLERSKKVPVSVVFLDDCAGNCRIFTVAGTYDQVVEVILDKSVNSVQKCGHYYYKFDADTNTVLDWASEVTSCLFEARVGYGMLLPLLAADDLPTSRRFSLISSNWMSLSPEHGLQDLIDGPVETRTQEVL